MSNPNAAAMNNHISLLLETQMQRVGKVESPQ